VNREPKINNKGPINQYNRDILSYVVLGKSSIDLSLPLENAEWGVRTERRSGKKDGEMRPEYFFLVFFALSPFPLFSGFFPIDSGDGVVLSKGKSQRRGGGGHGEFFPSG
jgi:hypothetical protein